MPTSEEFSHLLGHWYQEQDIEERIRLLEELLKLEPRIERWTLKTPREVAKGELSRHLGDAYLKRLRGTYPDNVERAISAYKDALNMLGPEHEFWGGTQQNLAVAYARRTRGQRTDNLESAIEAYNQALTAFREESLEWAQTKASLADAYTNRIEGEHSNNLELAIKACHAALQVFKQGPHQFEWAVVQLNLANAYRSRINGAKEDNLERAIDAYNAASKVFRENQCPREWATTQSNLALTYTERISGNRRENLDFSIASGQSALGVVTPQDDSMDWATAQVNLAAAYNARAEFKRTHDAGEPNDLERALAACNSALNVFTRDAYPQDYLIATCLKGEILLRRRDWHDAQITLAAARDAFGETLTETFEAAELHKLIEHAGALFNNAAYVATEAGEPEVSLALLNEGKAQLLAAALREQEQMHHIPMELRARVTGLNAEIGAWKELLRHPQEPDAAAARQNPEEFRQGRETHAYQRLRELRQERRTLLNRATKNARTGGILVLARTLASEAGAIVAPVVTTVGGKVLVITSCNNRPDISVVDLPSLTTKRLDELLRGDRTAISSKGWLQAFSLQYLPQQKRARRINEWLAAINTIGIELWTLFAGEIDKALQQLDVKAGSRIIWLPAGALGLLPLALACDSTTGRKFIDTYEIVYAPSLDALAFARREVDKGVPSLAIVVNPTNDLPYTEFEGALVRAHFADRPHVWLDKASATPEVVLAALKGKSYWHFSCHGAFDWSNALRAGLIMKDGAKLTVGALLETEGSLGRPRLVVLSACETGLFDANRSPDEFIGLPSSFIQVGATGVVSTLWQVDDRATALLMAKFFDLHLRGGLSPATALKQAQAWLRMSTKAELIAYVRGASKSRRYSRVLARRLVASLARGRHEDPRFAPTASIQLAEREPSEADVKRTFLALFGRRSKRPFAHPFYWGGFVYTGA